MSKNQKMWVYGTLSVLCWHMAKTPSNWFDTVWGAATGLGFVVAALVATVQMDAVK